MASPTRSQSAGSPMSTAPFSASMVITPAASRSESGFPPTTSTMRPIRSALPARLSGRRLAQHRLGVRLRQRLEPSRLELDGRIDLDAAGHDRPQPGRAGAQCNHEPGQRHHRIGTCELDLLDGVEHQQQRGRRCDAPAASSDASWRMSSATSDFRHSVPGDVRRLVARAGSLARNRSRRAVHS